MHVEQFVKVQNNMLQLEVELQRRRRAEISSLVPLDTSSISEEIIQDDFLSDQQQLQRQQQEEGKPAKKKRKWFRLIGRWLRSGKDKPAQTKQFQELQHPDQQSPIRTSAVSHSATVPIPVSHSTTSPSRGRRARHTSWAPGASLDQYRHQKQTLIYEGIHGLTNANIARALGEGRAASAIFLPHRSCSIKRDSAVFVQPSRSSQQQQPTQEQQQRRRSLSMRFAPQLGSLREEGGSPNLKPSIVAYRYPKMVSRQALRDAAIQVLSSDFSLWSEQEQPDDGADNDDNDDNDDKGEDQDEAGAENVYFYDDDNEESPRVGSIPSHQYPRHPHYYPDYAYHHHPHHHPHRHHSPQRRDWGSLAVPAAAAASHETSMKRFSDPGMGRMLHQM